jgi:hypothetical protein
MCVLRGVISWAAPRADRSRLLVLMQGTGARPAPSAL